MLPRLLPIAWLLSQCLFFSNPSWAAPLSTAMSGDLIFREGTEPVSEAVLSVDKGRFSHVGMLFKDGDDWKVIHSTPAEVQGRTDGVVIDSLTFFISPDRARQWEVFHVQNATQEERRTAVKWAADHKGTPFTILGNRGLYCTTLVYEAWQAAGVDLGVKLTHLQIPLASGDFLLPSGLLQSSRLKHVEMKFPEGN